MLRYIVSLLSLVQAMSFVIVQRQQQQHSSSQQPPSFGVTKRYYYPATIQLGMSQKSKSTAAANTEQLDSLCQNLNEAFQDCQTELTKTCKVKIAPVVAANNNRLGLVATESISKGDVALAIPYDDRYVLSADVARTTVLKDVLPDSFESWTGETGLMALLVLTEVARAATATTTTGADDDEMKQKQQLLPQRPESLQRFMTAWVSALPPPNELLNHHPLLWSEEDQEILQMSSTNKIYRRLDDIEEDATWLTKHVFDKDRTRFPETVSWNNNVVSGGGETTTTITTTIPCFNVDGFKWAMAIVQSRSFFLDGTLRLIPFLDMVNHDSEKGEEVQDGYMGTFGTLQGAKLMAATNYAPGDEVFCSYGPKSAADYLFEHGFCPEQSWKAAAVSELTFEIDPDDRFRDDKLDILEFETYDHQAPMDPVQSFDVVSAPGRDGEPDPAMMQFLRLVKLGGTDAFLLESIFRKDVWGFMELPVSEGNELDVVNAISEACQAALDEFAECPSGGPDVCAKLRQSEAKALTRTLAYLQREKEALDLKEYYQERRLKDLGLDSEWTPEDDMGQDLGFGQTRAPGGADYDW